MSILVFDLWHGVSGDMILGGLADLGLDLEAWREDLRASGLPQAEVVFTPVDRAGLRAMRAEVAVEANPPQRTYELLDSLLAKASLPAPVLRNARQVLLRLGEVEAALHGVPLNQVHFHELGALDTLVDIAGACLGFHRLGIDAFYTTAFPLGSGKVRMAHGAWREPVPATLNLIRGLPVRFTAQKGELCTPTGAALVSALAQPLPEGLEGRLLACGYGAGSRNPKDRPNVLRLCLLASEGGRPFSLGQDAQEVCEIHCNLDNMTPEHMAYLGEELFHAGAVDVWQQSIAMKKGRLGVDLGLLCSPQSLSAVGMVLARESLSGGYRVHAVRRQTGKKTSLSLATEWGPLSAKQVDFLGEKRILPEADAVAAMARAQGKPWHEIYRSALAAAARSGGE